MQEYSYFSIGLCMMDNIVVTQKFYPMHEYIFYSCIQGNFYFFMPVLLISNQNYQSKSHDKAFNFFRSIQSLRYLGRNLLILLRHSTLLFRGLQLPVEQCVHHLPQ